MANLLKTNLRNISVSVLYDARNRNSFCWRYFGNVIITEDSKRKMVNPDQVYCIVCLDAVKEERGEAVVKFSSLKIKSYSKTVSTGNLIRHLRDDHQIRDELLVASKAKKNIKDFFTAKRATKTNTASCSKVKHDKWLLARDIALWFCKSLLPFDTVADEGMVDFLKKYSVVLEKEDLPSRYTVAGAALSDVYECMLSNVKEKIHLEASRHCSITFDIWTDQYRKLNYITFTLHYLTTDFELKSFTLRTQNITGKKTGEKISGILKDIKKSFGLDEKTVHAVTDAGGNVKRAVAFENMEHHLCLGHGLHNLVTVDGINSIPEVKRLVDKCKKIVKTLRYRLPEMESEAEKVQQEFLVTIEKVVELIDFDENDPILHSETTDSQHLARDTESVTENVTLEHAEIAEGLENVTHVPCIKTASPTRWHSVLEMLESLIHVCNRDPVNNMLVKIGKAELKLTQCEWIILEDLAKFLKSFREAVEIMSSQKTCTLNVALVFRSEIIDALKSLSDDESLIMFRLKRNMLAKVDKRFPATKAIIAAALLDKRFMGLKEIDVYLESQNLTKVGFLSAFVKQTIKSNDVSHSQHYQEDVSNIASTSSSTVSSVLDRLSKKHCIESFADQEEDPVEQECWRYLATAVGSHKLKDGDLLSFWRANSKDFPWLSSFARALLCVPATSTPSERVFSVAGLVVNAKRTRLNPTRVNKIIFIHDNYKETKNSLE